MKLIADYNMITTEKIKKLYYESFPDAERKPFDLMIEKSKEGLMEILAILDEKNNFLGLAITIIYKDMVLLDYFAISPDCRGKQIGSKALQKLIKRYSNKKFLLEIEETDIESDNSTERKNRKKFYLKNGMSAMSFKVNLLGVRMEILTHNCSVTFDDYHSIYKNTFDYNISEKITLIKDC